VNELDVMFGAAALDDAGGVVVDPPDELLPHAETISPAPTNAAA
jgi:hypothetical protein